MILPCKFCWRVCLSQQGRVLGRCELSKTDLPLWVKRCLTDHCPSLGREMTLMEIEEYQNGRSSC